MPHCGRGKCSEKAVLREQMYTLNPYKKTRTFSPRSRNANYKVHVRDPKDEQPGKPWAREARGSTGPRWPSAGHQARASSPAARRPSSPAARRPSDGLRADRRAKRDRRRVPASYGAEEGAGPARHGLEPRNSENTSWGNVSTASAFRNTCTWGQNRGARPGGECG